MAKTKAQKKEIIDALENAFKNAASTVLVHFKGITIAEETVLRRDFRTEGVKYTVAKKTLIKRALAALGHAHADVPMDGEIAIAYNTAAGGDAVAPARLVHTAAGKFKDKLSILGGLFEGKLVDAATMQDIATIPSMQGLRGMFANIINSPVASFAIVLNALADKREQA